MYSTKPKYRKYVEGYGFLSFARKFGDKYGRKLMDTATKTGITASKRVVQESPGATGDLIVSKIADKITSVGKQKLGKKKIKDKKFTYKQKKDKKLLKI